MTAEIGLDLSSHISKGLTAELINWADILIVMEPLHSEAITRLVPSAEEKIRPLWKYADEELLLIFDPIGQSLETYRKCRELIATSLANLVSDLVQQSCGDPCSPEFHES